MSVTVRSNSKFSFIDLFAGIGGMRIAFERAGGKCVFASEWNESARRVYANNFGDEPSGDLTKINAKKIPDHDILVAGFPCQPFSLAGISKKKSMNRPVGFKDKTQGTLFFEIARILDKKRPRAFLLENVKNLLTHDKKRTFKTIVETLHDDLGYDVHYQVIDAKYLVPQHRERLYIVGFDKPMDFRFPKLQDRKPQLRKILDKKVDAKYTITNGVWKALKNHADKHRRAGNGFGYSLADLDRISRTLSARYYKDGAEILISQGSRKNPRRLTPRECARLMGFPSKFKIHKSDNQAYRQFGNAVVIPVVDEVADSMVQCMLNNRKRVTLLDYQMISRLN